MANKQAMILDTTMVLTLYIADAPVYTNHLPAVERSTNFQASQFNFSMDDCKYKENPGFVCPLKAYRAENLFFVNG
jgi:hypothetical protein